MTAPAFEDRTQFIGGSDIAAILGVDPYKTRLQVYEEKVGITQPVATNGHMRRGIRLEAVAAEEYTERTGVKLQRVNRRLVHPGYPFLTARIDRRMVGGIGRIAEIKCPSLGAFSKIKREGLHEGYITQFQHYLGLVGPELCQANGLYAEYGEWIIFCADQWDIRTFPVQPDQVLCNEMWDRCRAFWNENVLKRVPPPMEERDKERDEVSRSEDKGTVYDVSGNQAFIDAMQIFREARQMAAETELLGDEAKAQLKALIGDRTGAFTGPGFRLSYTIANGRSSFDKKALAGAKPLDRLAVGAILQAYWDSLDGAPSQVQYGFENAVIKPVGAANLDLALFESRGQPYPIMKPTFYEET